jgi:hypothetical protein
LAAGYRGGKAQVPGFREDLAITSAAAAFSFGTWPPHRLDGPF